jgi:hypothetical protein
MSQQAGLPGSHPVTMPNRQASASSNLSDDAVPTMDPKDVSSRSSQKLKIYANLCQTSELLAERLQAWKHAVGYLEDYVSATEKVEKAHAKEYEKVLKVRKRTVCLSKYLAKRNRLFQTP